MRITFLFILRNSSLGRENKETNTRALKILPFLLKCKNMKPRIRMREKIHENKAKRSDEKPSQVIYRN